MEWKLHEWAEHLRNQADKELRENLKREFTKASLVAEREGKLLAGQSMRVRTGRLRSSVKAIIRNDTDNIELRLRAGGGGAREVKYARIQEQGGRVAPRRGQYLAIPLPAALTAAGVLRGEFASRGGLRSVPDLFVFRARSGKLFLARHNGKDLQLLFHLRREPVTIRPKRFLSMAIERARQSLPPALQSVVQVAVGDKHG